MADSKVLTLGPPRVGVLVLGAGDSAMDAIAEYAQTQEVNAASLTAIGAFSSANLAYFDVDAKTYRDILVNEQTEVLSLNGDIALRDDEWQVHAHAVLGLPDGSTRGGHLRQATVRPTLEVVVTDTPRELVRRYDEDSGLALIDLAAGDDWNATNTPKQRDDVPRGITGDLRK